MTFNKAETSLSKFLEVYWTRMLFDKCCLVQGNNTEIRSGHFQRKKIDPPILDDTNNLYY